MIGNTIIVDLDGVVWSGNRVIEENVRALGRLGEGVRLKFITNNSTRRREEYAERLRSLGLGVRPEDIITSAAAAALWLRKTLGAARILMIGEEGLRAELVLAGHTIVEEDPDAVVVGLSRRVCYGELAKASRAIGQGALFIATNLDPTLPTEDGYIPGAGAIVSFLKTSTGKEPDFVAGKPNPWILEMAIGEEARSADVVVIGDRVDTDVELALRVGARAVLVLTGAEAEISPYKRQELERRGVTVVKHLGELIR